MQTTRRFGKSMFQRRVLVLAACAVVVNLLLAAQLFRLAVGQGEEHLQVAQSRLQVQTWLPTWRGSILDRHGRVLAEDRPAYDVSLSYDAITGSWIDRKAARAARESVGSERWRALGPGDRDDLIQERRLPYEEDVGEIWQLLSRTSGQSPAELEATRNQILQRIQHMAAVVWQRQRQQHENRFGNLADAPEFRERPIAEQEAFHVILPNVDDAQAIRLQQLEAVYPELVKVEYSRSRWRPESIKRVVIDGDGLPRGLHSNEPISIQVNDVGIQIIGEVRRGIWEEDMERRPFRNARTGTVDPGGYMIDDETGSHGIELGWEDELRGIRGSIHRRRDRSNETRVEPKPGADVQLTIDIELQARLEALLSSGFGLTTVQSWHGDSQLAAGSSLNAAAVVLEIETGEILAMASFPGRSVEDEMSDVEREVRAPWLDRVSAAVYPPGSIVKPLVLAAAVTEGAYSLDHSITCKGHHFPAKPNFARCWIYRQANGMATHGSLQAEEALARSCNCFFYELGARLGLARISDWMSYFGGGRQLGIGTSANGLPGTESPGSLPGGEDIAELDKRGESDFEAIMLGIGQGRFTWTPLHAANAFAILARHGRRLPPTLIRGVNSSPPDPDRILDHHAVEAALAGLEASVTKNHGTGSRLRYGPGDYDAIFDVDPVRIWGKTGTAQAPPMRIDLDGDGQLGDGDRIEGLHHAWFVGFVGEDEPEYAFAVVVEHGGSGGRVAGPIANQIVHALMDTGYLPESTRGGFH